MVHQIIEYHVLDLRIENALLDDLNKLFYYYYFPSYDLNESYIAILIVLNCGYNIADLLITRPVQASG